MPKKQIYLVGGALIVLALIVGAILFSPPASQRPAEETPSSPEATTATQTPTEEAPQAQKPASQPKTNMASTEPSPQSGHVIFAITDKPADMAEIRSAMITVSQTQVFNSASGWLTIAGGAKTFDLLDLKRTSTFGFLGEAYLKDRTIYSQMALSVSNLTITKLDGSSFTAKIPSNNLKLVWQLTPIQKETSAVIFDIDLEKSLHETSDGKYIFLPVIRLNIRDYALTEKMAGNKIRIGSGGGTGGSFGMDENGDIVQNYQFLATNEIDLVGNTLKVRPYDLTETGLPINGETALNTALGGKYLDAALSVKLSREGTLYYWRVVGTKSNKRTVIDLNASDGSIIRR